MQDDLRGIRDLLGQFVREGLDEFSAPEGPADLELLALDLIAPFADPEMPGDAVSLVVAALAERGDELAAGILSAMAELAPEPLSALAGDACGRLAASGIVSPHAEHVGALEARECYRTELGGGEAEVLGALLQRPGTAEAQAAVIFVEHEPCGGVIVEGLLGGPEDPEAVRALLSRPHRDVGPAEPVGAAEFAEALAGALGHMVEHWIELPAGALPPLFVLERALAGRPGRWPRPVLGRPEEGDDEDVEAPLHSQADALVEEFAASLNGEDDARLLEHGQFVAGTMCEWKIGYADGRLERWTVAELDEFLLEWYPRKGDSQEETVAAAPACVTAFLRFLADSGRLSGDGIELLGAAVARLRGHFEREARDPRNWGPAKSMVMQMRAEGVDPSEPGALDAWVEDFNARPFPERDRALGPAGDRVRAASAAGTSSRGADRREARRRASKAARKRNRR